MTSEDLRARLIEQGKAAGLSRERLLALLAWADMMETGHALLENISNGHMKIAGVSTDGEPSFSLTDAGTKYVHDELLPAAQIKTKP